jgi:4-amino-4-deoxy-L-arabinose transferase-like glycosyltransferase
VTPRLNGEPFLDKPALVNWLGAASISILGRNELAARFWDFFVFS